MALIAKKWIEERLVGHVKELLTEGHIWKTAEITVRKNKDVIMGTMRDSLDRGKYNGRNSLFYGVKAYLKRQAINIEIDAAHAWVLDPANNWHRRDFLFYLWQKIEKDEILLVHLATRKIVDPGQFGLSEKAAPKIIRIKR